MLLVLFATAAFIAFFVCMIKAQIRKVRKQEYNVQMRRGLISLALAVGAFTLGFVVAPTSQGNAENARNKSKTVARASNVKNTATPALATPAPEPTDTPELRKFRDSWSDVVERTTSAIRAGDSAQKYLSAANPIDASQELKNCEEAASGIKEDGSDMTTGDDSELGVSLWDKIAKIGDGLGYGCKSLRQYLDTQRPSDAADAKSQLASVPDAVIAAQFLAQEKYKQMGGDPTALLDFKSALRN